MKSGNGGQSPHRALAAHATAALRRADCGWRAGGREGMSAHRVRPRAAPRPDFTPSLRLPTNGGDGALAGIATRFMDTRELASPEMPKRATLVACFSSPLEETFGGRRWRV